MRAGQGAGSLPASVLLASEPAAGAAARGIFRASRGITAG